MRGGVRGGGGTIRWWWLLCYEAIGGYGVWELFFWKKQYLWLGQVGALFNNGPMSGTSVIPLADAKVHSTSERPQVTLDLPGYSVLEESQIETTTRVNHQTPVQLEYCVRIVRHTTTLTAHRNLTIRELWTVMTYPGYAHHIDGLQQVFTKMAKVDLDTHAQLLGPRLNFQPITKECITKAKIVLGQQEMRALNALMEFLTKNHWCIPWTEVSTGRFLLRPLFEQESLLPIYNRKDYLPIVVVQVAKETDTELYVTPKLLLDALPTLDIGKGPASVRIHRSRADGQDDYAADVAVQNFGVQWLRQWWNEKSYRFRHVYVQVVAKHTKDFPLMEVTFNHTMRMCTDLTYVPRSSTLYRTQTNDFATHSSDCLVPAGGTMFTLQGCVTHINNRQTIVSAFEDRQCVQPLVEALGRNRFLTIS